jgi:hypothetical protein
VLPLVQGTDHSSEKDERQQISNGGHTIQAYGKTQAEALKQACCQAEVMGLFRAA